VICIVFTLVPHRHSLPTEPYHVLQNIVGAPTHCLRRKQREDHSPSSVKATGKGQNFRLASDPCQTAESIENIIENPCVSFVTVKSLELCVSCSLDRKLKISFLIKGLKNIRS
jgi:hypothetical protein